MCVDVDEVEYFCSREEGVDAVPDRVGVEWRVSYGARKEGVAQHTEGEMDERE